MRVSRAAAHLLLLLTAVNARAQTAAWKSIYFFDEDLSGLTLHDIHWPGPGCMIALGVQTTRGRSRSVAVTSNDNGKSWALTPLKTDARSAFFLSERLGWIVTNDGLERTSDCGKTWQRSGKQRDLLRVWFRDEALGWGVGVPKKAVTTRDGGKTWKDIEAVNPPKSDPERSVFAWLEFANEKMGVMVGWHQPDRRGPRFPIWMDPEDQQYSRQLPSLTLMLQTVDGGQKWQGFTASLMGRMTRLRMSPAGVGVSIIEFEQGFEWPSEVYGMGVGEATVRRVYREKRHFVTDGAFGRDGWVYLAGVEVAGTVRLPVPGKVRIMRSRDLKTWTAMPVDYRASAARVFLATGPDRNLVAITDTGMILRLE